MNQPKLISAISEFQPNQSRVVEFVQQISTGNPQVKDVFSYIFSLIDEDSNLTVEKSEWDSFTSAVFPSHFKDLQDVYSAINNN